MSDGGGNNGCLSPYHASTHRIYMWSQTGSQMYAMDASGVLSTKWLPLNPTSPAGAPTARIGACLAWSGQTSSDNGHMWGEQTLVLFGGVVGGTSYTNEVNIYNIVNNSWEFSSKTTPLTPSPPGRYYHQCARFSSSGGGTYEYNGIVMTGGYNWQLGNPAMSDIWVFCDHAGTNPYETDRDGCGANVRKWVQFSYNTAPLGPCIGSGIGNVYRYAAAITEMHARAQPITNHARDDEFLLWGGSHSGTPITEGFNIAWRSNTNGGTKFDCFPFVDYFGDTAPMALMYPGAGYRSAISGLWEMATFGGWTGSAATNGVYLTNWEVSTGRIYYYFTVGSGAVPAARYISIFPCHYNEYPPFPTGCATPTTFVMFGGTSGSTAYSDTRGAYVG